MGQDTQAPLSFDEGRALEIIGGLAHLEGAMLPILHALQDAFGHIDARMVPLVASALNVSRADAHGAISFYHDFRDAPAGRHVLRICRAESCQSMGCERLVEHLRQTHRLTPGETTADGALTLENVYCLGQCALSPAALVDGEPVGRLDEKRLDALLGQLKGAGA
jgi:formate dehydrogenase subunit gamma